MLELAGDIWQIATKDDAIVIPTNIGWKADGTNVMGRGLARQAARRWPELPRVYGEFCKRFGAATPIMLYAPPNKRWCWFLLLFPVKPLNTEQPYLSWRQPASVDLIRKHAAGLAAFAASLRRAKFIHSLREDHGESPFGDGSKRKILVPTLGCGNGGLDASVVLPILKQHLTQPCFCHVTLPAATDQG